MIFRFGRVDARVASRCRQALGRQGVAAPPPLERGLVVDYDADGSFTYRSTGADTRG
jgi:hypothetical protein